MIETERLLLRAFVEDDLHDMNEFCSQPEIETVGWSAHKSVDETKKVLDQWRTNENTYAIVYKKTNKVIGYIAIHEDSEEGRADTRELGYALNNTYRRQGIMSEAIRGILEYLFCGEISFVWACCFQFNIASKKLIEKLGFQFMGEGVAYSYCLSKEIPSYEYRMSKSEWAELNGQSV